MFHLNLFIMKKQMMLFATVTTFSVVFAISLVMGRFYSPEGPLFLWESTTHDFGVIEKGNPAEHQFYFTNDGDVPLIISGAKASCGCTVANYSKVPIAPGKQGFVTVRYDAAKVGVFIKTITISANTGKKSIVLTLKGEVKSAE